MKAYSLSQVKGMRHLTSLVVLLGAAGSLAAADTNAPPTTTTNAPTAAATNAPAAAATNAPAAAAAAVAPLTPEQFFEGGTNAYNNWVEFGLGGFITHGNKAQFQQNQQASGGVFGGLQDLHIQQELTKGTTLTLDGRAIGDEGDYKARVDLTKEKLGYVRFSYDQFRTWYNTDGGYFPPTGTYYKGNGDGQFIDRGDISFEAGLTLDNAPKVVFKYDHTYRGGEKGSTIWGTTHPTADTGLVRGLGSSFYDIDERSDIFQLDATHHIKSTDVGLGLRYETGKINDALNITQNQNEPAQQKITDQQNTSYDLFNVHGFAESWLQKNLLLSGAASYSTMDNDLSGSRVYGNDFDVGYVPALANGVGYNNLSGSSRLNEVVADLNLLYKATPHLSIVPSVRIQSENADSTASGFQTVGVTTPTFFTGTGNHNDLDVRERLDLTYNGFTNIVLYGRGELAEGSGNLNENGGMSIPVPPIDRQTDEDRFFQKYSLGSRFYPTRGMSLDVGGYYKRNAYSYDNSVDSTPNDPASLNRYPAYLALQNFNTYDGNIRLTLRPMRTVSTITRYEYQYSTIYTRPDPVSELSGADSSRMTSHIIAQDISWTPWSRLYLQTGFNYVWSQTATPASDFTASVLNAQNNYWTLTAASGVVLDDKTDLRLAYVFYRANDYQDNSAVGVPYGAGGEQNSITATLTRRFTKNIRWSLKYGFTHYTDQLYGDNRNYQAHMLYSGLQYRF
jgi:hypothetical protein